MSWFLIDDAITENPKVIRLLAKPQGFAALGFWAVCGAWCRKYRTQGDVSAEAADMSARKSGHFADASALSSALVDVGMWLKTADGYRFNDWSDVYTKEDKDAERKKKDAERKRRTRAGRTADKPQDASADNPQDESADTGPSPSPSPDPSLSLRSRDTERVRVPEWEAQAYAASVPTRFRALYEKRFRVDVAVGGRNVGDFPERLANTARAQGVEPLALLDQLFATWVDQGRPGVDKQIPPYPAFVARFDSLAAPALAKADATPQQRLVELDRKQKELMTAGNFGPEYQALCDQAAALRKDLDPPRGGEPRRAFGR